MVIRRLFDGNMTAGWRLVEGYLASYPSEVGLGLGLHVELG